MEIGEWHSLRAPLPSSISFPHFFYTLTLEKISEFYRLAAPSTNNRHKSGELDVFRLLFKINVLN